MGRVSSLVAFRESIHAELKFSLYGAMDLAGKLSVILRYSLVELNFWIQGVIDVEDESVGVG